MIISHTKNHKLIHVEGLVSYGYAFFTIDPQISQPPYDKKFKARDAARSYPHLCHRLMERNGGVASTVSNLCISLHLHLLTFINTSQLFRYLFFK